MFRLENINKREYGKILLQDLSLKLEKGETLVIFGDEKSGRKDILDMISGFKKPNSGQIFINKESVVDNVLKARRNIGYTAVLEVYNNFTIRSFLKLMIKVREIDEKDIDNELKRVLELVRFNKDLEEKIGQLSYVDQKKLTIASAFIGSPLVILLDDLFLGASEEEKKQIIEDLKEFKKDYICIVATNDEIIKEVADKVIILSDKGQELIDFSKVDKEKNFTKRKTKRNYKTK